MADTPDETKQEPTPKPPVGPQPDPWHDGADAEPAADAAAAEPETKKVPHPWHD